MILNISFSTYFTVVKMVLSISNSKSEFFILGAFSGFGPKLLLPGKKKIKEEKPFNK